MTNPDKFYARMAFGAGLLVFLLACAAVPLYLIERAYARAERERIARCERDGYEWRDDGYRHPRCYYGGEW